MARPHDTLLLKDRLKIAIWQSAMRPLRVPCSARLTYAQSLHKFPGILGMPRRIAIAGKCCHRVGLPDLMTTSPPQKNT